MADDRDSWRGGAGDMVDDFYGNGKGLVDGGFQRGLPVSWGSPPRQCYNVLKVI